MKKERSSDRCEGPALALPGFTAFGPEWPSRGGGSAPPFRHLARRSGRIPAEPYPPARCCQYRPAEADYTHPISQSDLPETTPARYNYRCPATLSLAAFEVTLIGRFSGAPRGSTATANPLDSVKPLWHDPPMRTNPTPADYQYLRDFIDRLEKEQSTGPKKLPRADAERCLQTFARVWRGQLEVGSGTAENLLMFLLGVLVSCFVMTAYHYFVSPSSTQLNNSLPSATI
jgi:hypothetical protein